MLKIPRTYRKYRQLCEHEWAAAVALFERGDYHANKIAEIFGVCEKTMRAGLKARGARKACRVNEVRIEMCALILALRRANEFEADLLVRRWVRRFEKYPGEAFEPFDLSEFANMDPFEGFEDLDLSAWPKRRGSCAEHAPG
ncbi:hypothetical protein [Aquisediminimonas profunda]|uniref:hypothetical protein n=1 Tax=Aquisediminimonas profunda TaxID=1550733 RepID=UPI001C63B0EC|nr:hypothetical protein [Aquisediminimonas profunda]